MATGNLSLPRVPNFPGLESFKGRWYHSGLWPEEGVDFSGRRVGVIGTGSSGIQMIPVIAEQAEHLFVFQRTANFSVPAVNRPITPEVDRSHKAKYSLLARRGEAHAVRNCRAPLLPRGPPSTLRRKNATRVYEEKWGTGGNISFLYAYNDLLVNKDSNETASEFVRNKIRSIVTRPEGRRAAVAERSSDRNQEALPRYRGTSRRSTATTSRSSTSIGSDRSRLRRQGCGRRTREFELDDIVVRDRLRRHDGSAARHRHFGPAAVRAWPTNGLTVRAPISG